jgi:hypothetical protein
MYALQHEIHRGDPFAMRAYSNSAINAPVESFPCARAAFEELVVALSGSAVMALDHAGLEA